MRKKKKEFSVLKWIIFPLNSVVLAGIIAYFNITVFGYRDGLPYTAIVALIGVFSILINRYTESENRNLAKAAFIFEIVLTAALIINACYSVSVQRKMSVARMAESSQKDTIGEISKLKGSRTQREALKVVDKTVSAQSVFSDVENILFWIMAGELGLYGLSAFTLFAIAKLVDDDDEPEPKEEEFPASLDVQKQSPAKRSNLAPKTTTSNDTIDDTRNHKKTTPDDTHPGFKALRETLKLIAFANPPGHFKVDLSKKGDYLIIRHMESNRGDEATTHSVRARLSILDDAQTMPREAFKARVERLLRQNGFFEIGETE
jgi:hypothetical protein